MLADTTLTLPFAPTAAVSALLIVTVGSDTPTYAVHPANAGTVALGPLPSGASLTVELRWFGADGVEIGADGPTNDPTTSTLTLPSGADSPLSYTIVTRPSPMVPPVEG